MIEFKNSIANDSLPYDFEVEYIEKVSGNAYFQYPFSCHNVDTGETAYSMPIASGDKKLCGIAYSYAAAIIGGNYRHGARASWFNLDVSIPVQVNKKVIVGMKDQTTYFFKIDDNTYTKQVELYIPSKDDKSYGQNFFPLFAEEYADQLLTNNVPVGARIFYSIRYDGKTKELLNFIYPVSVNGQVMLYDRVQKNFLQQIGSGTFLAGPKSSSNRKMPQQ